MGNSGDADDPVDVERMGQEPSGSAPGGEASESADRVESFDIGAWAADREIVADLNVDRCEPARIGDKPADTLWCFRHEERTGSRIMVFRALYLVRDKRLARVLEIPSAAGGYSLEGAGSGAPVYAVQLAATVSKDGKTVTIADPEPKTCDKARRANEDAYYTEPIAGKEFRELIEKVCAARGSYRWAGGALRRVSGP
jgi:hypothetical protein